jgi:hypothetical protein
VFIRYRFHIKQQYDGFKTEKLKAAINYKIFTLPGSKVKVKVKFNLEQVTKAHRGSRGIALLFLSPRR